MQIHLKCFRLKYKGDVYICKVEAWFGSSQWNEKLSESNYRLRPEQIKSSNLYLYSALYNTDCVKAALQFQTVNVL